LLCCARFGARVDAFHVTMTGNRERKK